MLYSADLCYCKLHKWKNLDGSDGFFTMICDIQMFVGVTLQQEADGEVVVEGLLNICWGVRRPIRLKIQDDKQMLPFVPKTPPDPTSPISPLGGKRLKSEL